MVHYNKQSNSPEKSDTAAIRLEPCPFCGKEQQSTDKSDNIHRIICDNTYQIVCDSCKATGPAAKTKEIAIRLWNEQNRLRHVQNNIRIVFLHHNHTKKLKSAIFNAADIKS